jgi:hypothetical protein
LRRWKNKRSLRKSCGKELFISSFHIQDDLMKMEAQNILVGQYGCGRFACTVFAKLRMRVINKEGRTDDTSDERLREDESTRYGIIGHFRLRH